MSRQLLIRHRMLLYQQCSGLCTLCYLRAKHAFCRQRDVEEIFIRRTNAHVTRTEHSSCDHQSNRALLCLGVNSGRLTGLLAFRPPLFSIILLLFELILVPTPATGFEVYVIVGFTRASRLRYLLSRSSVLRCRG